MDKERFKKLTNNKNFIPGIYNYCDRWCEKCAFTSQCSNYAVTQEIFDEMEDINDNENLFKALSDIFRITMELIEETAEKFDIDLSEIKASLPETPEEEPEEEPPVCIRLARKYAENVSLWFEKHQSDLQALEDEFNRLLELGVKKEQVHQQAGELKDFIDVIRWYQYFIEVKLHRAMPESNPLGLSFDGMEDDMNGSAKVALIAIDRSIGAWGKFLTYFPEAEDDIFDNLVLLNQIRKLAEEKFPDARKFIRPGLDE